MKWYLNLFLNFSYKNREIYFQEEGIKRHIFIKDKLSKHGDRSEKVVSSQLYYTICFTSFRLYKNVTVTLIFLLSWGKMCRLELKKYNAKTGACDL